MWPSLTRTFATHKELSLVYVFEFYAVTKMTLSIGLRLWPLTAERAFISAGLTRAVLELGHPKVWVGKVAVRVVPSHPPLPGSPGVSIRH